VPSLQSSNEARDLPARTTAKVQKAHAGRRDACERLARCLLSIFPRTIIKAQQSSSLFNDPARLTGFTTRCPMAASGSSPCKSRNRLVCWIPASDASPLQIIHRDARKEHGKLEYAAKPFGLPILARPASPRVLGAKTPRLGIGGYVRHTSMAKSLIKERYRDHDCMIIPALPQTPY
jgi:hypothetical protein